MAKTRLITIKRTVTVEVPKKGAKNGETERIKVQKTFPCMINAGVPFNHKMCE